MINAFPLSTSSLPKISGRSVVERCDGSDLVHLLQSFGPSTLGDFTRRMSLWIWEAWAKIA